MRFFRCHLALFLAFAWCMCAQAQNGAVTHEVKNGETLYSIANLYHLSVSDLEKMNPGSTGGIKVGQRLKIPQQNTQANAPRYHTIEQGETLYRLTQKYNVSAQAICDANPGLSAENFRSGQVILIPESTVSASDLTKAAQQTPAPPRCKDMHKVKRRQTVFSIAKEYDLSEQELVAANPELKDPEYKLKKGTYLCIPYPQPKVDHVAETAKVLAKKSEVKSLKTVNVGVILPMERQNAENARMLEYYRGLLLAVDSVKKQGLSVEVYAYDSGVSASDMQRILEKPSLQNMNVIFGPLYPDQVPVLGQFARQHNIKLVVPFTNKSEEVYNNPSIYQVNAPKNYQYGEVNELFLKRFSSYNIIFLESSEKADKFDYVNSLKQVLQNKKIEFTTLPITAPSVDLEAAMSMKKNNLLITNSASVNVVNQLMPRLSEFKRERTGLNFSLLGYPEWQTYTQTHLENFYAFDTYVFTSFYRNPVSRTTGQFERKFRNTYHKEMIFTYPRFAMLGFDTGYFFLKGLAAYGPDGIDDNLKKIRVTPYQNTLEFKRLSNWSGFVNKKMEFIHYRPDNTIEIIELQ